MKLVLFYFLMIFSLISLSQDFELRSYSIAQGLPQSQVYDITEDHNGNLWIATQGGGIAKFDGVEFDVFTTREGLINNFVSSIYQDSRKNLWIATSNGLSQYNGIRFRNYKLEGEAFKVSVSSIAENKKQELFFGTSNGVYKRTKKGIFNISKEIGLSGNTIIDVYIDESQNLWVAHNKGFSRIKKGKAHHFSDATLSSVFPQCFFEGVHQNIWIGTYGRGLVKVRGDKYQFVPETDGLIILDVFKEKNILWLSTFKNGILTYDIENRTLKPIQNHKKLPTTNCRKLYKDSWGGKWIGTSGGGLLKYSQPAIKSFNEFNGLIGKYIYTVAPSLDSGIWVSTNARKLFKLKNEKFEEYGLDKNIYPLKIKAILEDLQGRLWLGTEGYGLMLWDKGNTKMLKAGKQLMSSFIKDIIEDKQGFVWVATPKGITRFSPDLSSYKFYTKENNAIHFNRISCLHIDRKNRVWYGTEGAGLGFISDSSFTVFQEENGLSSNSIRDIVEDKLGNLFIATADAGVDAIEIYSGVKKIHNINSKNGLSYSNIYSVFCDENNRLWLGGAKGVSRINHPIRNEKEIKTYGLLEGFVGLETNQGAVCTDAYNNIWWGTISGVMKKPNFDLKKPENPPKISISSVNLFYKNIQGTKYEPNILNWYKPGDLIFDSEDNHIGFELDGNDLLHPEGMRYIWRLDGGNGRWSPPVNQKKVFFSNLSPGRYIFQAKAINKDGVESDMLQFFFTVSAPFYHEIWFWLIVFLILTGVTYWILKRRITQIKNKANEEAEKLKLEKEVLEMEQKALRLQMNPHFIFNALNAIQDQIRAENNKAARHSLSKFSKLMRQILDSSRTDYISLELELNILDNYLNIEKITRNNSFQYRFEVSSEIDVEEEGIPPMLIQPFLENAIIHGIANLEKVGEIKLSFSVDEEFLIVTIEDNGIGVKKAKQLKAQKSQQHKSIALEVIQSRLQNLSNGDFSSSFSVEDKLNDKGVCGTSVLLKVKRQVVW
ncbi:MAG: hypothetical protein CMP67_09755 [Flavobacteriales bacterium]|nr:hypothetical protein [Flavobacteriales bacterium]